VNKRTTLTLNIQTHKKLNVVREKVEKIMKKTITLEQTVQLLLETKGIDEALSELLVQGGEE